MKKIISLCVLAIVCVIAFSAKTNNSRVVYYWKSGYIIHKDHDCAAKHIEKNDTTAKLMMTLSTNQDISKFPYTKCFHCNK